jgi:hypothetical protein
MLSNCALRHDYLPTEWPYYMYDFIGDSMTPVLTDWSRAIVEGDHLNCDKENILPSIEAGTFEKDDQAFGPLYVFHPFFDKEIAGHLKAVSLVRDAVKISFLNPDKIKYPDIILRTYEIKAVYEVVRIDKARHPGWCQCATEADYCGAKCKQPQNNPDLEKGGNPCI